MKLTPYSLGAATLLFIPLAASECNLTTTTTFSNHTELFSQLNGSTTICGDLVINNDFSGPVNLTGIKSINGSIRSGILGIPSVASIVMDDLTSITGDIRLYSTNSVPLISMAKLETVMNVILTDLLNETSLDFPSLRNASSFEIFGEFSRLNFPLVNNITNELQITRSSTSENIPSVSFPSLERVGKLELKGDYSNISFPVLQFIGQDGDNLPDSYPFGVNFITTNIPLDLRLPALTNITKDIDIEAPLYGFSLPSLVSTGGLKILTTLPLNVSLPALYTASDINLSGNITSVDFPKLKIVNRRFYVSSTMSIDCYTIEAMQAKLTSESWCYYPNYWVDRAPKKSSGGGLSFKAKLGIGLGVGMPGVIGLFTLYLYYVNWLQNKKKVQRESNLKYTPVRTAEGPGSNSLPVSDGTHDHELDVRQSRSLDGEQTLHSPTSDHSVDRSSVSDVSSLHSER